jgi:MFS family permease
LPATFAVVATSLDKRQHAMGVGVQSMIRRVPVMVGPIVGGWLITRFGWEHGVRLAVFGCIALNVATALFQWCMAEPALLRRDSQADEPSCGVGNRRVIAHDKLRGRVGESNDLRNA